MQLSVAFVLLSDELIDLEKRIILLTRELEKLPDEYISYKKIKGKIYPYLQKRSDKKIVSKIIKKDEDIKLIEAQQARRKEIKQLLKKYKSESLEISKILKKAPKHKEA